MHIKGEWRLCDDGIERPVIRGQVRDGSGRWVPAPFLVDTGADRTVISANILAVLSLPPVVSLDRIGGVGGLVGSVIVARPSSSSRRAAMRWPSRDSSRQ